MSIGVMLFNPFTGAPRHPDDIKSDPDGILVWDGEAQLRAYKAAQPDCRTCVHHWDKGCAVYGEDCINGDKYEPSERVVLWRTE